MKRLYNAIAGVFVILLWVALFMWSTDGFNYYKSPDPKAKTTLERQPKK